MQYYVRFQGKRIGPIDAQRVEQLLQRGQLTVHHEISDTEGVWQRIGQWQKSQAATAASGTKSDVVNVAHPNNVNRHAAAGDELPTKTGGFAAGSDQWHVAIDGEQSGPYSEAEVGEMIRAGQILSRSQVWRSGMDQWRTAEDVFPGAIRASHENSRNDSGDAEHFVGDVPTFLVDSIASRRGWVTTVCVFAYALAIELFTVAAVLAYLIAQKSMPNAPTILLPILTVSTLVMAILFLAIAIHLTRLSLAMNIFVTHATSISYRSLTRHEDRMWLTTVVIGSFLGIVHVTLLFIVLSL